MTGLQCHECGQFVKVLGARHNGQEGYAASWFAVALCRVHGEVPVDWDMALGDFDPDDPAGGEGTNDSQTA